jgi:hypothetical protein
MVVIFVDDRTLPRLARPTAVAAEIISPAAAFAATTAPTATLATPGLKIPPLLTAATAAAAALAPSFAGAAPLTTAALALASPRAVTTVPTTVVLPCCGLGRSRGGGRRD